ncbi:hypothetical protein L1785_02945 [Antribacter sp. KLBMP9083]|uniref:Uncharacterized protein n=1 Tax=Antribacter soli TaxID=2910976 RepID=A0AA41U7Z4_9MICO|nr:hypothetical protein [Antribacter soli]MCF4119927.1 hypothetical protein [Antribacter soli]
MIDELTPEELAVVAGALGGVVRNLDPDGRFLSGAARTGEADADVGADAAGPAA